MSAPVFVINLDRHPDRFAFMAAQLTVLGRDCPAARRRRTPRAQAMVAKTALLSETVVAFHSPDRAQVAAAVARMRCAG